ncbi:hypothetical protein FRB94_002858 [Tulasnella sp. JGI-2019a]|nr:hypothetical protein FRB93_011325 [Tulasnella sp. JGI-2019a]KAG9003867.1 hypothetical protein FRB94_002858 [Tulasnella sp. JGI-2019a]
MFKSALLALSFSALFALSEATTAENAVLRRHHNHAAHYKRAKSSAGSGKHSSTTTTSTATSTTDSSYSTSTGTSDAAPTSSSSSGGFISSAYMANWDGSNKTPFYPADLPVDQLTHVNYAFAVIASDGTISSGATSDDLTKKFPGDNTGESGNNVYGNFKQLFLLKQQNRNLKTILSIGGGGAKNFQYMTSASYRATFVKTAVKMVSDFGFDGVDVDWEFPSTSNIGSFYSLLSAFRTALDNLASDLNTTPFLLSIAIPGGGPSSYYTSYVSKIDKVLDMWNVMNYDICGFGYQSTACDVANVKGGSANGQSTVEWLLSNGATATKIINGNPLYGYVYTGTDGHDKSYNEKNALPGDQGPGGYSVKDLPLSSMTDHALTEDKENIASYAYSSSAKILASYDTPTIAALKAEWIISQKLGGAMYWEISSDHNTTESSLVYQYAETFRATGGGLAFSCNHIDYSTSSYDNIKNGMGIVAKACVAPSGSSGDGNSSSPSTTTTSAIGAATGNILNSAVSATATSTSSDAQSTGTDGGSDTTGDGSASTGGDSSTDIGNATTTLTTSGADSTATDTIDSAGDCSSDSGNSTGNSTKTKRSVNMTHMSQGRSSKKRRSSSRKAPLRLADFSI